MSRAASAALVHDSGRADPAGAGRSARVASWSTPTTRALALCDEAHRHTGGERTLRSRCHRRTSQPHDERGSRRDASRRQTLGIGVDCDRCPLSSREHRGCSRLRARRTGGVRMRAYDRRRPPASHKASLPHTLLRLRRAINRPNHQRCRRCGSIGRRKRLGSESASPSREPRRVDDPKVQSLKYRWTRTADLDWVDSPGAGRRLTSKPSSRRCWGWYCYRLPRFTVPELRSTCGRVGLESYLAVTEPLGTATRSSSTGAV